MVELTNKLYSEFQSSNLYRPSILWFRAAIYRFRIHTSTIYVTWPIITNGNVFACQQNQQNKSSLQCHWLISSTNWSRDVNSGCVYVVIKPRATTVPLKSTNDLLWYIIYFHSKFHWTENLPSIYNVEDGVSFDEPWHVCNICCIQLVLDFMFDRRDLSSIDCQKHCDAYESTVSMRRSRVQAATKHIKW